MKLKQLKDYAIWISVLISPVALIVFWIALVSVSYESKTLSSGEIKNWIQ